MKMFHRPLLKSLLRFRTQGTHKPSCSRLPAFRLCGIKGAVTARTISRSSLASVVSWQLAWTHTELKRKLGHTGTFFQDASLHTRKVPNTTLTRRKRHGSWIYTHVAFLEFLCVFIPSLYCFTDSGCRRSLTPTCKSGAQSLAGQNKSGCFQCRRWLPREYCLVSELLCSTPPQRNYCSFPSPHPDRRATFY